MILAAAENFEEAELDIGKHLWVEATDKSETAYKMTYLQLAFRGIPAHVIWGDSLSMETYEHTYTPDALRFRMRHGGFGEDLLSSEADEASESPLKSRGVRKRTLPDSMRQSAQTKPPVRKRKRPVRKRTRPQA